jgi:ABC-type bacteriocin/lantibiotic exporter with double-glycine peptidase domain
VEGEIEFRGLNFELRRQTGAARRESAHPRRHQHGDRGPDGLGKNYAGESDSAHLRRGAGHGADRWPADPRFTLASLRKNIGFVPQETFLFSDRIRENIALGVESATDERFTTPPKRPTSPPISKAFPSYQTMVGERGITLSGGQKQRTAIARALIRNPRILILDDALSSVDTHTEDKILNHLRDVMQGRTTIFISHRVSTVRNADRIAVLHGGRIVELGHARRTARLERLLQRPV